VEYNKPIDLRGKQFAIALKKISLWNSWHNISQQYKNNTFDYFDGERTIPVTIPDGNYTAENLNDYFESANIDVKLTINYAVSRFVLEIGELRVFDISKGTLCELLGFKPDEYKGTVTGQHVANISRGVDILLLHCSLISSSRYNEQDSDILFTFTPRIQPGALIDISINEPIYRHGIHTSEIRSIRVWLTDQDNRSIDINHQSMFCEVLIKSL
jgi:hypothetical protein